MQANALIVYSEDGSAAAPDNVGAAAEVGCHPATIKRAIDRGELFARRLGDQRSLPDRARAAGPVVPPRRARDRFVKMGRNLLRSTTLVDPDTRRSQQLTEEVLRRRVDVARGNPKWTELEGVDLVTRGPFKVSATSDEVFTLRRGTVFDLGSANLFEQTAALHFVVTDDNDLIFYELHATSWSDIVARKARRGAV